MILGLGTDIVRIERIEAVMQRFGDRFMERSFTKAEREKGGDNPRFYAKRFAAKEACAKALGTGFRGGILLKEIEVVNASSGAPGLVLHGAAKAQLDKIHPQARLFLSLSDERDQALAVVVIECE